MLKNPGVCTVAPLARDPPPPPPTPTNVQLVRPFVFTLHTVGHQNINKVLEITHHYFNQNMIWGSGGVLIFFSPLSTLQLQTHYQKLRSFLLDYRRETERQRACFACHEELVWLRAMQLEAITEPITFCLLLSFFRSLILPPLSLPVVPYISFFSSYSSLSV